jgi:hypothetical protein
MKKSYLFAFAAATALTVSCSNDELVNEMGTRKVDQTPIGFNVQKQNITRAVNLETVKHYNFGVWAWKVGGKNNLEDQEIMNNYLVGYSNETNKIGYEHSGATTWAAAPGETSDHTSPWIYEGLGTAEYTRSTNAAGENYYLASDADYVSKNANQYLRYWDLAYDNTNFYCYAPYNKSVTFEYNKTTHTGTMTFPATTSIRDGYEEPQNTTYAHFDRSLSEFMYATDVKATNANLSDVTVPFKHMGAQLFIRFYEEIPGYKVEIIDLNADRGASASTDYDKNGIQAAPAIAPTSGTTYVKGSYYTTNGATLNFDDNAATTFTPDFTSATTVQTPLMFKIPQAGLSTDDPTYCPSNLTSFTATTGNTTSHNVIKEKVATGTQDYSYSPTIYYPVAQPTTSTTGLTFHISYRIIAEDNGEVTTIHNATVHVPVKGSVVDGTTDSPTTTGGTEYYITAWQPNVKYTYTFKFTKNSTGTTNPDGSDIDPTDPTPSTTKSLYPIVFDAATIEDFTTNYSEYIVSVGTSY